MTEATARFNLPYILPSQAQKHVTHNEALRMLDALLQISVLSRALAAPPPNPAEGECYLVPETGATGAFTGHEGDLAAFQDGAWAFYSPAPGWTVFVQDELALIVRADSGWIKAGMTDELTVDTLGINATADATNRLAVKADAALFSHAGETGGSGDMRLTLNKQATADTASLVFQTGWSGRAEFGLAGDDNWHVKVSPDGDTWTEALVIDAASGNAAMGGTPNGAQKLNVGDGSANTFIRVHGANFAGYNFRAGVQSAVMGLGNGGGLYLTNYTAADMTFNLDGAERLRLKSDGRIGIGTVVPTTTLHVEGPVRIGSSTVAALPDPAASATGAMIYVTDLSNGGEIAFSDGTTWRKMSDRTPIT